MNLILDNVTTYMYTKTLMVKYTVYNDTKTTWNHLLLVYICIIFSFVNAFFWKFSSQTYNCVHTQDMPDIRWISPDLDGDIFCLNYIRRNHFNAQNVCVFATAKFYSSLSRLIRWVLFFCLLSLPNPIQVVNNQYSLQNCLNSYLSTQITSE